MSNHEKRMMSFMLCSTSLLSIWRNPKHDSFLAFWCLERKSPITNIFHIRRPNRQVGPLLLCRSTHMIIIKNTLIWPRLGHAQVCKRIRTLSSRNRPRWLNEMDRRLETQWSRSRSRWIQETDRQSGASASREKTIEMASYKRMRGMSSSGKKSIE